MDNRIKITITDLNQHGQGVGQDANGLVHFVDDALPEETVLVTVERKSASYVVSSIHDILIPSPDRTEPPCPVFDRCGGCSLQHLDDEAELRWKQKRVLTALERIGKLDTSQIDVHPICGMEDPWRYRNKASYPFTGTTEAPVTGFYATRSHQIVPHDDCLLLTEATNEVKRIVLGLMMRDEIAPYNEEEHEGVLRHLVVRHTYATNELMVVFVVTKLPEVMKKWPEELVKALQTAKIETPLVCSYAIENHKRSNVVLRGKTIHLYGEETVTETLNGISFNLRPEAFFQVNTKQAEKLFSIVEAWASEAIEISSKKQALDLYCGSGSIALHLARQGIEVTGVEIVPEAIEEARAAAIKNGIALAKFVSADIIDYVRSEGVRENVSLVVLDPPRKGCDQRLLDALLEADHVQTIVYVSCNPATLARDLGYLAESYALKRLQAVDMFPHTTHVETVVLMSRVDK